MKTKRVVWTVAFLSVTLAAIVMEVVAGIFHPAGTIPWTEYLARYVPWPIQLGAYVALAVWLPFHFWRHDHLRKLHYRRGYLDGKSEGYDLGLRNAPYVQGGPVPPPVNRPGRHLSGQVRDGRYLPGRSDGR